MIFGMDTTNTQPEEDEMIPQDDDTAADNEARSFEEGPFSPPPFERKDRTMQERHPIDREAARRGFTE
jgi:hypothetical protein